MRLFAKLLILTLSIGLLPLLALSMVLIDTNAAALRNSTRQLHLSLASDASRAVRMDLSSAKAELTGIGQLLLAPGLGDDATRLALAGSKVTSSDALDYAAIYDPGGRMIVALHAKESAPIDPPRQLDGEVLSQLTAGALIPGQVRAGPKGPLLPLYVALAQDGQRKAIVGTAIDLRPLCKTVSELADRRLEGVGSVMVVNEKRELIVAPDPARVLRHESLATLGIFSAIVGNMGFRQELGAAPEFEQDGIEMLGALEAMPEQAWAVIVQEPRAVAYHSLLTSCARKLILLRAARRHRRIAGRHPGRTAADQTDRAAGDRQPRDRRAPLREGPRRGREARR